MTTTKWLGTAAIVLAAAMAATSCSKCGGGDSNGGVEAAAAVEPPVPAPAGLLADLYMPTPNATWAKIQRGIGGAVGILPASVGGIMGMGLGLDPMVANEIDGNAPVYGVIAGDPGAPSWTVAFKLNDVRKAKSLLADGEMARFTSRERPGVTELVAREGTAPPNAAVGITSSAYLVLAKTPADLEKLVPYVTRTLPTKPLPNTGGIVADVARTAITSTLKPKLDEMWAGARAYLLSSDQRMRAERGGRAPDFGDPKAIVDAIDVYATKRLAVVGDLERMRITLDVNDDGVSLVTSMTPASGTGPAAAWTNGMKVGDVSPATAFPSTSAIVMSMRDNEQDRAEQGKDVEKAMTSALGTRLGEADAKKLHDTIEAWTKARGETTSASLAWDEPQGVVLRTEARDVEAASRAVKGAVELSRVTPFKEMLRVKDATTSTDDVGLGEKASLTVFLREPPKPDAKDPKRAPTAPPVSKSDPKKDELALAWIVDSGSLTAAMGSRAIPTLRGAVKPEKKLADEPAVMRPLRALGSDASLVLVAQPLRFDPSRANLPTAPLVIAIGRKEKDAFVRLDVANGLLRELARWQMGL